MFHPKFRLHTTENDLAIMRTESTMVYSKSVQPAKLPAYTYRLRDNESMWAVGWGETSVSVKHLYIILFILMVTDLEFGVLPLFIPWVLYKTTKDQVRVK